MQSVPNRADVVLSGDISTLQSDPGFQAAVDSWLSTRNERGDGPTSFDEALGRLESEFDIASEQLNSVVAFAELSERGTAGPPFTDFYGIILNIDITIEDVRRGIERATESVFKQGELSGKRVYQPESGRGDETIGWVGMLSEQNVVVGTESAVKDTVRAQQGDVEPIDADLSDAYSRAQEAPIRFASRLPQPDADRYSAIPERHETLDYTRMEDIQRVHGSISLDGDTRVLTAILETEDSNDAERVSGFVTRARETYRDRRIQPAFDYYKSSTYDDIVQVARDILVSTEGSDVVLTVERTVSELESLVDSDRTIEDSG